MLFEKLEERGFVYQTSDKEKVKDMINNQKVKFYYGVDPTADCLHIGHCMSFFLIRQLQKAGHTPIIVFGGATALIGDPTGKSDMRKMISEETVLKNIENIKKLVKKFLICDEQHEVIFENNLDWFKGYDYINFMRDIGVHFNVNKMLTTDAFTRRMEQGGLTFLEMGYMLMQAYDFLYLNRKYDCKLEVGGSDQWANILAGAELGRKVNFLEGKDQDAFQGLTIPLLVNADGVKMGKTEKGALWVDEEKTPVLDFYQYFYNIDDRDVEKLFKLMTELPLNDISQLITNDIREAKHRLAYEITALVHGEENAKKAQQTAKEMFAGNNFDNAPEYNQVGFPVGICELMKNCGLAGSTSEARRLISQGGVSVNGEKLTDFNLVVNEDMINDGFIVKKGKKAFIKIVKG